MKKMPTNCPACNAILTISELKCSKCGTVIHGDFPISKLLLLSQEDQEFLAIFLRSRGNIKEVQERLGISYPTAKNRLDKALIALGLRESEERPGKKEILDALEKGEITAKEAVKLIKEAEE
ncbi:MAG: DUF2089 domain-containing protein [Caldisericaceae bacterium]|nr:DUF2089 domain-containing protein [Caldisericaceae bacterium]